jgi:transposase
MTLHIGVDFHPHQQSVSYCDTGQGEVHQASLVHNLEQVRRFYRQLPKAVVGIEASCTAAWFEQMLSELGHELKVGNPSQIRARARSRHKSDKRDADLLLELLLKDEFPELWRRSISSQSILEQLRFRHRRDSRLQNARAARQIADLFLRRSRRETVGRPLRLSGVSPNRQRLLSGDDYELHSRRRRIRLAAHTAAARRQRLHIRY